MPLFVWPGLRDAPSPLFSASSSLLTPPPFFLFNYATLSLQLGDALSPLSASSLLLTRLLSLQLRYSFSSIARRFIFLGPNPPFFVFNYATLSLLFFLKYYPSLSLPKAWLVASRAQTRRLRHVTSASAVAFGSHSISVAPKSPADRILSSDPTPPPRRLQEPVSLSNSLSPKSPYRSHPELRSSSTIPRRS